MSASEEAPPSGVTPALRIGILAGEVSGDILGAEVLEHLRMRCPQLTIEGIGGPLMEAQGLRSMYPMERLSVMGLVEPLKRLPELLRIRRQVFHYFRDNPPDVFLGIDAPDFNLRLEQKLRAGGVTTAHLVSPSVWAWRRRRIHKIKRAVDLMLTLFPFETDIYREHNIAVEFVGHPLADQIPLVGDTAQARASLSLEAEGPVLALLPGSRSSEVRLLAPLFLQAACELHRQVPALRFVMPAANKARLEELQRLAKHYQSLPLTLILGQSREAMAAADVVLLASGTASLEALLLKKPMVIAYRMASLSWMLVSRITYTAHVGLPNILSASALVPELLQQRATVPAMVEAVLPLLQSDHARNQQLSVYEQIHRRLRCDSGAATAGALLQLIERKSNA